MKEKTIKDLIDDLNSGMGLVLLNAFGLENLDFSEFSLEKMEEKINDSFPVGHKPLGATTFIPFGWYLGECVVRNIPGAKWVVGKDKTNLFELGVVLPSSKEEEEKKTILLPFIRIRKFWYDRSDGLAVFYRTMKMISIREIEQVLRDGVVDSEGWVHFPNGDRIRITKQPKDLN